MPDKKKRIRTRIIATLWIGILAVILSGCSNKNESDTLEEVQVQQRKNNESAEMADGEADATSQMTDTESAGKEESGGEIFVFVCGQVASPGVYELAEGSRI